MYFPLTRTRKPRRGIILLVVVALLTLFAVVGITFVLYAQSRADVARIFRDSQQQILNQGPPDSGQMLLTEFLNQFIYDVQDTPLKAHPELPGLDTTHVRNSALRGHSLARSMYGWNPSSANTIPYSGIGRLRSTATPVPAVTPPTGGSPVPVDEYDLVNYTWFQADTVLHDPERQGWRANDLAAQGPFVGGANVSYTYPDQQNMFLAAVRADGTVLCPSYHRPWLTRKYFGADFTLNPLDPNLVSTTAPSPDPKWLDAANPCLRYMTLRPRPADMDKTFPVPINGGDVKNLTGAPGGNDSIWLDIGYPVQTLPDGRSYKPLFAPLIIDLDSRVNLNVHGNLLLQRFAANRTHASNQGWGPWEVNLAWVLNYLGFTSGAHGYGTSSPLSAVNISQALLLSGSPTAPLGEWRNILAGTTTGSVSTLGRYGPTTETPTGAQPSNLVVQPLVTGGDLNTAGPFGTAMGTSYSTLPPFYSAIDFDGANEAGGTYSSSGVIAPPTTMVANPFRPFPTFGVGYGNGVQGTALQDELSYHPLLFNFYHPANASGNFDNSPQAYDASFGQSTTPPTLADSDALALLYDLSNNTSLSNSTVGKLCPRNFGELTTGIGTLYLGDPRTSLGVRRRMLVTTRSFDVDKPAYTPWVWDRNATGTAYALSGAYPVGALMNYPPNATPPIPVGTAPPTLDGGMGSDFNLDWRGNTAFPGATLTQGRLDLNRPMLQSLLTQGQVSASWPFLTPYPLPNASGTIDAGNMGQFGQAQADRKKMAKDLFARLQKVTGAADASVVGPGGSAPNTQQYDALRWLAQLAVNMVDFVDSDDIMTPFNWNEADTSAWVFGTELPRLLVNEVYAEAVNDPSDPAAMPGGGMATMPYKVNFAIELHNPLPGGTSADPNMFDGGQIRLVQNPADATSTAIYQILIAKSINNIRQPTNVLGDPDPDSSVPNNVVSCIGGTPPTGNTPVMSGGYSAPLSVLPATTYGEFGPDASTAAGFFVLGSVATNALPNQLTPVAATMTLPALSYTVPTSTNLTTNPLPPHTVLLRRLACPWLPYNPTAGSPNYNPYVTVDYMENVPVNNGVLAYGSATNPAPLAVDVRRSYGRTQPYANPPAQADVTTSPRTDGPFAIQPAPSVVASAAPSMTTFFQHNNPTATTTSTATLQLPFYWLTHLDRQVVSPTELLEVSGYKPHELTHQFVNSQGDTTTGTFVPYQHRAPWFDNNARIYRIFEFLETWNRSSGMGAWPGPAPTAGALQHFINQRVAGKVNINTIWDPEILLALADPQPNSPTSNAFVALDGTVMNTPANINANLFNSLYSTVGPAPFNSGFRPYDPTTVFGQLLSLRTPTIQGFATNISGSLNYAHVPGPNDQPFMGAAFGAYPTTDPQFPNGGMTGVNATLLRPLAIVTGVTPPGTSIVPGTTTAVTVNSMAGISTNMAVTVDTGANEETVIVGATTGSGFTATFVKSHNLGCPIGRLFAPINYNATVDSTSSLIYGNHPPHQQHQLLNKLFNNITTRSNVFAVWLTVGLFQVMDDSTVPNKLGAELGSEQLVGGNPAGLSGTFRHHMFAIVDRSALCSPANSIGQIASISTTAGVTTVTTTADLPPNSVQPGTMLAMDSEIVMILDVAKATTGTILRFKCNNTHAPGASIQATVPGNPGPLTTLSNTQLIPFSVILD